MDTADEIRRVVTFSLSLSLLGARDIVPSVPQFAAGARRVVSYGFMLPE
jgi:hypothetical protein